MNVVKAGRTYIIKSPEEFDDVISGAIFGAVARIKRRFIDEPKELSSTIFRIVKQGVAENFEMGRSGSLGWPRLKRITYVMRAMKGYPIQKYPVLRRTGALERGFYKTGFAIERVIKNTVAFTLTNDVPYAGLQNDGGVVQGFSVPLKSTYRSQAGGNKRYSVLVDARERGLKVKRKYKHLEETEKKPVNFLIPPRRFAFISDHTFKRLNDEVFSKVIQKEFTVEDPALDKATLQRLT
jgi:phage gpG-like protein